MRGVRCINAVALVAEIGDATRFDSSRKIHDGVMRLKQFLEPRPRQLHGVTNYRPYVIVWLCACLYCRNIMKINWT